MLERCSKYKTYAGLVILEAFFVDSLSYGKKCAKVKLCKRIALFWCTKWKEILDEMKSVDIQIVDINELTDICDIIVDTKKSMKKVRIVGCTDQ